MKHKEIFKIYNVKDIKRNKFPIFCISISLFLAMLVSLVIPLIQIGKEQFINDLKVQLNTADLMVTANYTSVDFNNKIDSLEKEEGIHLSQIDISPSYLKKENNQIIVYFLTGYDNLKNDDVIVSKNFADKNNIKIGDNIKLSSLETTITVTAIEQVPVEVTLDAEVAGYVKLGDQSSLVSGGGNSILFLSGKDGNLLKDELSEIEEGYKYYTYQERQDQLYGTIDKEMGALSLISSVGFISSISVLVSGIMMLVIKAKKDIANLMLISIKRKDIIKAMKAEVNLVIFIPLVLATIVSIPLSMILLKFQGLTMLISSDAILKVVTIIIFDLILFGIYRNLALMIIKKFDPIFIEKGESGIRKIKFYEKIYYLAPFPISMFIYSAILQSGASVSINIFLSISIIILFFVLWGFVSVLSSFPFWKRCKLTMYTFQSLRSNKIVFVIGALNLTMLICFIFIGFNLSSTLKTSIDKNLATNIPYNYMVRSLNEKQLEESLNSSSNLTGYIKMDYLETKIEDDNIKDKSILLMNRKSVKGNLELQILNGDDLNKDDDMKVLVSEKYANAYNIEIGAKLDVYENGKTNKYTVKGIYDSGGINVNWLIKESENSYGKAIYLVKYNNNENPSNLSDCYISNVALIGEYSLSQANSFLESFKLLSFIFILSAIIFNINVVYMGQQLLRKDFAILEAIGIGNVIIKKQMLIKALTTVILSLIASTILYTLIMNMMIQMIAKGNATLDIFTFVITCVISIIVVCLGYLISLNTMKNCIDEIRE